MMKFVTCMLLFILLDIFIGIFRICRKGDDHYHTFLKTVAKALKIKYY